MRLELELLTALLVDVRAPEHGPQLPLGGQRNGPRDLRAGLFRGAHDVGRGLIDQGVVERFETDTDPASHRRSEEHTSELQSPCNLVCRLLLEKKKTKTDNNCRP